MEFGRGDTWVGGEEDEGPGEDPVKEHLVGDRLADFVLPGLSRGLPGGGTGTLGGEVIIVAVLPVVDQLDV